MLQYTTTAGDTQDTRPRRGVTLHHTDANRVWAYDRDSVVRRLGKALDPSKQRGWGVSEMKIDWAEILPAVEK